MVPLLTAGARHAQVMFGALMETEAVEPIGPEDRAFARIAWPETLGILARGSDAI